MVCVELGSTLLAVVVVLLKQGLRVVAHAEPVLPDLAGLALDHELARVGIVFLLSSTVNYGQEKGCSTHTAADTPRHALLLLLGRWLDLLRAGFWLDVV